MLWNATISDSIISHCQGYHLLVILHVSGMPVHGDWCTLVHKIEGNQLISGCRTGVFWTSYGMVGNSEWNCLFKEGVSLRWWFVTWKIQPVQGSLGLNSCLSWLTQWRVNPSALYYIASRGKYTTTSVKVKLDPPNGCFRRLPTLFQELFFPFFAFVSFQYKNHFHC